MKHISDESVKAKVAKLIETRGATKTAELLGINVDTVVRIAAGVRVRAVSLNAARYGLLTVKA